MWVRQFIVAFNGVHKDTKRAEQKHGGRAWFVKRGCDKRGIQKSKSKSNHKRTNDPKSDGNVHEKQSVCKPDWFMNCNGAGGHFGSFVRRRCRRVAFSVQVVRRDETWNQNDCGKQPVHDIFVRVKVMLNIPAR